MVEKTVAGQTGVGEEAAHAMARGLGLSAGRATAGADGLDKAGAGATAGAHGQPEKAPAASVSRIAASPFSLGVRAQKSAIAMPRNSTNLV